MEPTEKLKQEIFDFMHDQVSIHNAITFAENKFCKELEMPDGPIAPILDYDQDIAEVEWHLQKLKEYKELKLIQKDLVNAYCKKRDFCIITIIEYIKEAAHFERVPEIYTQKVLNHASKRYKNLYEFFCNLNDLTDIFNI